MDCGMSHSESSVGQSKWSDGHGPAATDVAFGILIRPQEPLCTGSASLRLIEIKRIVRVACHTDCSVEKVCCYRKLTQVQ